MKPKPVRKVSLTRFYKYKDLSRKAELRPKPVREVGSAESQTHSGSLSDLDSQGELRRTAVKFA